MREDGSMSKKSSQVIILCEDTQQEVFVRRFLKTHRAVERHTIRVIKNPSGKGAGEHFVREHFPLELKALRQRAAKTELIVVIDADTSTVSQIMNKLERACCTHKIDYLDKNERVALIIPRRNIETWITYLNGQSINEETAYPKLQKESDCQTAITQLSTLCDAQTAPENFPDSLRMACHEYTKVAQHAQ